MSDLLRLTHRHAVDTPLQSLALDWREDADDGLNDVEDFDEPRNIDTPSFTMEHNMVSGTQDYFYKFVDKHLGVTSYRDDRGLLHRISGPAVERADGTKEYFIEGHPVEKNKFRKSVKKYLEQTAFHNYRDNYWGGRYPGTYRQDFKDMPLHQQVEYTEPEQQGGVTGLWSKEEIAASLKNITYEELPWHVREYFENYFKAVLTEHPDLMERLKTVKIDFAEKGSHGQKAESFESDNRIEWYGGDWYWRLKQESYPKTRSLEDIRKSFINRYLNMTMTHELTHIVQDYFKQGYKDVVAPLPNTTHPEYYDYGKVYHEDPGEQQAYKVQEGYRVPEVLRDKYHEREYALTQGMTKESSEISSEISVGEKLKFKHDAPMKDIGLNNAPEIVNETFTVKYVRMLIDGTWGRGHLIINAPAPTWFEFDVPLEHWQKYLERV
jgi:hypothetical protein